MEKDKEYLDFLNLGNQIYHLQDYGGIVSFNNDVLMHTLHKKESVLANYGITKCEYFTLIMMEGFFSEKIQCPLVYKMKPNKFIEQCIIHFDHLLMKTPLTSSTVLYRQDKFNDVEFYAKLKEQGKPYVCNSFLTTSTDDYDNSPCTKLIIYPQKNGLTKAHDVYKILNHGEDINGAIPEYQVNFERGSKFLIEKINYESRVPEVFLKEI